MNKDQVLALMTDDVEARKNLIAAFLKDHSNSFEDRKEVFLATPEHLYSKDGWILHLSNYDRKHGEISWFDDFYAERYTDVDLADIIRGGMEEHDVFKTEEMFNDFVKEVVDRGYHSFCLDW